MKEHIKEVAKAKAKAAVWRDAPGYEGYYQVSNTGIVRSLDRWVIYKNGRKQLYKGKIIDGYLNKGYKQITLSKNGKTRTFKVSQLVAMAFLDHEPNGNTLVIDHIDGDRTNDNVDNLRIVAHRDNITTCFRKDKDSFTSEYVGVSWAKNNKKWVGKIVYNGVQIYLGYFDSEIKASEAYQLALSKIEDGTFNPE